MERDFDKFKKWESWNRELQLSAFAISKAKKIEDAKKQIPYNAWFVKKMEDLQFQFNRDGLIGYGNCKKFKKPVSFIPYICQIDTQDCFEHRNLLQTTPKPTKNAEK